MVSTRRTQWRAYRMILGARVRSQTSYRASFLTDVLGSLLFGLAALAEVWVVFHNVPTLGGVDFHTALLIYGLVGISYGIGDLLFGHVMTMSDYVRLGQFDALCLRPLPLLGQVLTSDITLRRFGRVAVGIVALATALQLGQVELNVRTIWLLLSAVAGGILIFGALFLTAGAVQFFVIDGAEITSSFTYGANYAANQVTSIFPSPMKILFSFVIPAAFVGYLPVVALLRLPTASLLPGWLGWCTPAVGGLAWLLALLIWRCGTRHYQGAGG